MVWSALNDGCEVNNIERNNIESFKDFIDDFEEEKLAKDSQKLLEKTGKLSNSIVTEIKHIKNYYIAEEYHQNYFDRKNFLTDLI